MKYILFLLLFSKSVFGQSKPESVWGIKFGTRVDSVKILMAKKTSQLPKISANNEVLTYQDISFGGRTVSVAKLLFFDKALYGVTFYLFPEKDPQILEFYRSIKKEISDKWGEPETDVESYKYPYEKGDGHELTAIKGGYSTIGCVWKFRELSAENTTILLSIEPDVDIYLSYMYGPIYQKALQKSKEKNSNDY